MITERKGRIVKIARDTMGSEQWSLQRAKSLLYQNRII